MKPPGPLTLRVLGPAFVCALLLAHVASAANTNAVITVLSTSSQFVVEGVSAETLYANSPAGRRNSSARFRLIPASAAVENMVLRLDPASMAVSCERTKQALLRELSLPDRWRGQIQISIEFTARTNQPVNIQPVFLGGGWRYRMVLPDEISARKLLRSLVQVLLLEIVNRRNGPILTEIPLWIPEGLTAHLMVIGGAELVVQPYSRVLREELQPDTLAGVRQYLQTHSSLTFNQLSLPTPDLMAGDSWASFQACSQLLLTELLRLPNGATSLQAMFEQLPNHLNWQMALLRAFQPRFRNFLEVEKWWALVVANAQGIDQRQIWLGQASWQTLDQILRLPAQVRQTPNTLPANTELTLQRFIELFEFPAQTAVIRGIINQLRSLRMAARADVVSAIDAYLGVLVEYLERRSQAGFTPETRGASPINPQWVARDATRKLDALDSQREGRLNRASAAPQ